MESNVTVSAAGYAHFDMRYFKIQSMCSSLCTYLKTILTGGCCIFTVAAFVYVLQIHVQTGTVGADTEKYRRCVDALSETGTGILLDTLGLKRAYPQWYIDTIKKNIELMHPYAMAVAQSPVVIEDVGRVHRKKVSIVHKTTRQLPIIVIDNRAWDIEKCSQRVKSNQHDGDARFVLGCYYVLTQDYFNGISLFYSAESFRYSRFSSHDMNEWLGYAYFSLGRLAKWQNDFDTFFHYCSKELQVYRSALTNSDYSSNAVYFKYVSALVFIDIGLCLEKTGLKAMLCDTIALHHASHAYQRALQILVNIDKVSPAIHEMRAYVYEKLGKNDHASKERLLKQKALQALYYEQKYEQVCNKISMSIENDSILTDSVFTAIKAILREKYVSQTRYGIDPVLAFIDTASNDIAFQYLDTVQEMKAFPRREKRLLVDTIQVLIKKRLVSVIHPIETAFLVHMIDSLMNERAFATVVQNISLYENLAHAPEISETFKTALKAAQDSLAIEERRAKIRKQKIAAQRQRKTRETKKERITAASSQTAARDTRSKHSADTDTLPVYFENNPPPEKDEPGIHIHESVGLLIDELIEQQDFIGAYRGVKVYEKMLKDNFGIQKIDQTLSDLELLIVEEYGKKYLKELQAEYAK